MSHDPETQHPQTEQRNSLARATGSAEQRALSLEAAILWGEGDESLEVSLGVAAAMEPTEDEGSTAARLLAAEVRRLRKEAELYKAANSDMRRIATERDATRQALTKLLPWAKGCTTSNPERARAVRAAELLLSPNKADMTKREP